MAGWRKRKEGSGASGFERVGRSASRAVVGRRLAVVAWLDRADDGRETGGNTIEWTAHASPWWRRWVLAWLTSSFAIACHVPRATSAQRKHATRWRKGKKERGGAIHQRGRRRVRPSASPSCCSTKRRRGGTKPKKGPLVASEASEGEAAEAAEAHLPISRVARKRTPTHGATTHALDAEYSTVAAEPLARARLTRRLLRGECFSRALPPSSCAARREPPFNRGDQ